MTTTLPSGAASFVRARLAEREAAVGRTAPDAARRRAEFTALQRLVDDLMSERHLVAEDCWYTCAAATTERDGQETCNENRRGGPCDCGRDARVLRRLFLLAAPYADHPDCPELNAP